MAGFVWEDSPYSSLEVDTGGPEHTGVKQKLNNTRKLQRKEMKERGMGKEKSISNEKCISIRISVGSLKLFISL